MNIMEYIIHNLFFYKFFGMCIFKMLPYLCSRSKLAIVDDNNTCVVYDMKTKGILFQVLHNSIISVCILCYSMYLRTYISTHSQMVIIPSKPGAQCQQCCLEQLAFSEDKSHVLYWP